MHGVTRRAELAGLSSAHLRGQVREDDETQGESAAGALSPVPSACVSGLGRGVKRNLSCWKIHVTTMANSDAAVMFLSPQQLPGPQQKGGTGRSSCCRMAATFPSLSGGDRWPWLATWGRAGAGLLLKSLHRGGDSKHSVGAEELPGHLFRQN